MVGLKGQGQGEVLADLKVSDQRFYILLGGILPNSIIYMHIIYYLNSMYIQDISLNFLIDKTLFFNKFIVLFTKE